MKLQADDKIIDALITKLEDSTLTYTAGNTLVAIGARAVPALLQAIHNYNSLNPMNSVIMLLAKFPEHEAEEALLALLNTDNCALLEFCAISLAYRSRKYILSSAAL